jgi:isoquinoline 1-oxidoreductase alpha subunit
MAISFRVNDESVTSTAAPDTPLVWVLREHLRLTGTRIGCGQGVCGSCTVHVDGQAIRACVVPLSEAAGKSITTIEGLSSNTARALQNAWVEEQVPQCGYCQSGQIMQAETLLAANASPSRDEIVQHMDSILCRCGTYGRIISAIERASKEVER